MLVEHELERAIISAIEDLRVDGLELRGAWQVAGAGADKTEEEANGARAICVVACKPRRFTTFGLCEVSFDISLAVAVRSDRCPSGSDIIAVLSPLSTLVTMWQMADAGGLSALTVPDAFYPGGVLVQGGEGPIYDRESSTWTIVQNLTVSGTITHNGGK